MVSKGRFRYLRMLYLTWHPTLVYEEGKMHLIYRGKKYTNLRPIGPAGIPGKAGDVSDMTISYNFSEPQYDS